MNTYLIILIFYRFMLSDASIPVMEKAAQDPDRKVTFVDLIPGRLYNITLWTVSGANFSHSKKIVK